MWRSLTRTFWFIVALVFVIEAWLWDHLEPIVERCVALLPMHWLKALVAEQVEDLSPPATLIVFCAISTIIFAKLVGLGVTSFLFTVTRDKLLQMDWFRAAYEKMLEWRAMAQQLVEPFREQLQKSMQQWQSEGFTRFWRLVMRMRRKAQTVR
jgi:hypothetical protein